MNEIIKRITATSKMRFRSGASFEQISTFEQTMGITLPSAYKEWLTVSDGGEIFCPDGPQLLGVTNENSKLLIRIGDGVEAPKTMIVIGRTSSGDALCLENGAERVIQWSHSPLEEFMSWDNFFCYLKQAEEIYGDEQ